MNGEDTRIFLQQLDWIPSLFSPVSEVHPIYFKRDNQS